MFNLAGKAAFVTGASRGIGRSVAVCLAQAGAQIALVGRDAAALNRTLAEVNAVGGRGLALKADVTDAASVQSAADAARTALGKLDVLVCNAGAQRLKPFLDMTKDDWHELIATNLEGAIVTMQCVGR